MLSTLRKNLRKKVMADRIGFFFLTFVLLISGCAGSNFTKPDPDSFVLGKTTQAEVSTKMGKPYRTGTVIKNGQTLETASYAYANVGGESLYPDVTSARSLAFYFKDGTLVGTESSSSFKSDGTDFDETKATQIEKGKTTKAEVVQLLGSPGGYYIPPMIPDTSSGALGYVYSQVKGSAFNLRIYSKVLIVSYDSAGVVTNVDYTAQGKKD